MFISLYRSAGIEADLGFDDDAVVASYLQARKDRAEPLHGAARFCRLKERYQQGFDLAKRGLLIKGPDNAFIPEDWIYAALACSTNTPLMPSGSTVMTNA